LSGSKAKRPQPAKSQVLIVLSPPAGHNFIAIGFAVPAYSEASPQ
jgi:hypothetical protein